MTPTEAFVAVCTDKHTVARTIFLGILIVYVFRETLIGKAHTALLLILGLHLAQGVVWMGVEFVTDVLTHVREG